MRAFFSPTKKWGTTMNMLKYSSSEEVYYEQLFLLQVKVDTRLCLMLEKHLQ